MDNCSSLPGGIYLDPGAGTAYPMGILENRPASISFAEARVNSSADLALSAISFARNPSSSWELDMKSTIGALKIALGNLFREILIPMHQ